jgi:hypothetical protein
METDASELAREIRSLLKERYPNVKLRVTVRRYKRDKDTV